MKISKKVQSFVDFLRLKEELIFNELGFNFEYFYSEYVKYANENKSPKIEKHIAFVYLKTLESENLS